MCIQGVCTQSASVVVSSCPFGDDLILNYVNFFTSNGLPSVQMTCEVAWNFGMASNNNFCSDSSFKSACCNYCKRKFFYTFIMFF